MRRCYGLDGKRLNPPKDLSEKPRPDLRRGAFPFQSSRNRFGNFGSTPGGTNGQRTRTAHPLKTDKRTIFFEVSLGGKLRAKSSGWDENRTFLENDVLEVEYAMAAG